MAEEADDLAVECLLGGEIERGGKGAEERLRAEAGGAGLADFLRSLGLGGIQAKQAEKKQGYKPTKRGGAAGRVDR